MLKHHLLDSLAIQRDFRARALQTWVPAPGFPGLPLALFLQPRAAVTLIDSTAKKIRFVSHAAHALGTRQVRRVHARAKTSSPRRHSTGGWCARWRRCRRCSAQVAPTVRPAEPRAGDEGALADGRASPRSLRPGASPAHASSTSRARRGALLIVLTSA